MKNITEMVVYVDPALEKLIPRFMESQRGQIQLMKSALQTQNYSELRTLGHRMRGSCGGYGFSILGDCGGEIEKLAETKSLELLSQCISQMENYVSNLKVEYRKK